MEIRGLWLYVQERCPPAVIAPLALVLAAGGRSSPARLLCAAFVVFLLIFVARAMDDIADLDRDRLRSPWRVLALGKVSVRELKGLVIGAGSLAALCGLAGGFPAVGIATILTVYYLNFPALRRYIPLFMKTFCFNVLLLFVPMLSALILRSSLAGADVLQGAFLWLSAVGHEYLHSCAEEPVPKQTPFPNYRTWLSPRTVVFGGGLAYGVGWACLLPVHGLSPVVSGWAILLSVLLSLLIVRPTAKWARVAYVAGFFFVAVPWLQGATSVNLEIESRAHQRDTGVVDGKSK